MHNNVLFLIVNILAPTTSKVCLASCMVLSSHLAVFAAILGMWFTFLQSFWCLYLYLSSIQIHMLRTSSFLYPCGCCATAVRFVSKIEKELLFSYHSWQCHAIIASSFLIGQ